MMGARPGVLAGAGVNIHMPTFDGSATLAAPRTMTREPAMPLTRLIAALLASLAAQAACAAVTTTVIDVQRPFGIIRVQLVRPDVPVATLLMFTGGDGFLGLASDGTASAFRYPSNPPSRNTQR